MRTDSTATAAWKRGPNALAATPAGSSPRVRAAAVRAAHALALVLGHRDREPRQLLDLMARRLADGDQLALARRHARSRTRAASASTTSSTADVGNSSRPLPSCPGWAPCLRPDGSLPRRGGAPGGSALGGCDELRDDAPGLALQLRDPLVLLGDPRSLLDPRLDLLVQRAQQHRDDHVLARS